MFEGAGVFVSVSVVLGGLCWKDKARKEVYMWAMWERGFWGVAEFGSATVD